MLNDLKLDFFLLLPKIIQLLSEIYKLKEIKLHQRLIPHLAENIFKHSQINAKNGTITQYI